MGTLAIESTTKEKLRVPIISRADPTGNAVEFSITALTATDPGSYIAGSWETGYTAATGRCVALTPTIGAAGQLVVTSGTNVKLWVRWSFGTEVIVDLAALITVT